MTEMHSARILSKSAWIEGALRAGIALVFLFAALPKILSPLAFLGTVYSYEIVDRRTGLVVAAVLPMAEIAVAAALICGVRIRGAAALAILLSGTFVIAVLSALLRDLVIDCGCFGVVKHELISWATLARTVMVLLATCMLYALLLVRDRAGRPQ